MAQQAIEFSASARPRSGKGAARQARREGNVPAVIYGGGEDPVAIAVGYKELHKSLHEPGFFNRLVEIDVDGEKHLTLCRDVQLHPVTDRPEHADFLRVSAKTRVAVAIPVVFLNEEKSPGLKRGGVLNVVRYEVECFCQADKIPERIEVDLGSVKVGESIHVSSVTLPEGVEPTITDRDFTIATLAAPRGMKASDAEDGEGEAEGGEG